MQITISNSKQARQQASDIVEKAGCVETSVTISLSHDLSLPTRSYSLYLNILVLLGSSASSSSGPLLRSPASNAAWAALAVRRSESEVDVLLRVNADKEGGGVHQLLADAVVSQNTRTRSGQHLCQRLQTKHSHSPNVPLSDEHASVVDGLGEASLEDLSLKAALHQSLGGELQHVIERLLVLAEQARADHAAQESITLKDAPGVLRLEGQELTSSLLL
jgi:hypothetical protein